jgi:hypothetical protein
MNTHGYQIVLGLLVLTTAPAYASLCSDVAPRLTAAFVRRLGRDTGNLFGAEGTSIQLVESMSDGQPSPADRRAQDKAIRLWGHTDSKIRRKCSDAEAASVYNAAGVTTADDALFNRDGLPWVAAMQEVVRPLGAKCAQVALVQAGYAARDEIRSGLDRWVLYGRLVSSRCGTGVFEQLHSLSEEILMPDLGHFVP